MMAEDEDRTLSALRAHRNTTDPVILNHGGRIVKTTGDGMLVEFPSATSALDAAIEVQDLMRTRNAELPESRRMQLRLGINLGDVVVDESGDVFGDGVNIAARVEALADPGGIAVTNAVVDAVRGRLDVDFVDDGEHELKNIPRPVRVWRLGTEATPRPQPALRPKRTLATIAVLPFDNLSGDPEQEYFADGITEDLLTALSYDRSLAVVARSSTFAYKDTAADIRTVARELDATHVVEGSVRKAGDRVRVTVQLVDAETGHHIWAERYDRSLSDIFELQDELVDEITSRLRPTLLEGAGRRRATGAVKSVDAWDLVIQGQFHVSQHTPEGFLKGIDLFEEARRLEPDNVSAIAGSATAWMLLAVFGWRDDDVNPWERGFADAEAAHAIDADDYDTLFVLSAVRSATGRPDEGIRFARKAIELNPHSPAGYHMLGHNLDIRGESEDAIPELTQAWRLGRHEPSRYDIANDLAHAHYMAGKYEAALMWGRTSLELVDDYLQARILLAATLGQLDRPDEARPHVESVLRARPGFSCAQHRSRLGYVRDEDRDHFVAGLVKAGLPE